MAYTLRKYSIAMKNKIHASQAFHYRKRKACTCTIYLYLMHLRPGSQPSFLPIFPLSFFAYCPILFSAELQSTDIFTAIYLLYQVQVRAPKILISSDQTVRPASFHTIPRQGKNGEISWTSSQASPTTIFPHKISFSCKFSAKMCTCTH